MTNERAKSELMQIYMSLSEEKKQALDVLMAQADGEYISRKALLEDLYKRDYTKFTHRDFVALVQYQDIVAIPPDHDGCKDCKHELKSDGEYPCSYCKQNYKDMWEMKEPKKEKYDNRWFNGYAN